MATMPTVSRTIDRFIWRYWNRFSQPCLVLFFSRPVLASSRDPRQSARTIRFDVSSLQAAAIIASWTSIENDVRRIPELLDREFGFSTLGARSSSTFLSFSRQRERERAIAVD